MLRGAVFSKEHRENLSIAQRRRFRKRSEILGAVRRAREFWERGCFKGNSKAAKKEMSSRWKSRKWKKKMGKILRKNHRAIGKTLKEKAALVRRQSGSLGPRFGRLVKKKCWSRSKGRCLACKNKIPVGKQRIVHHVNLNRRDNRRRNLIALCRRCHWIYHTLLRLIPLLETFPKKMREVIE